MRSPAGLMLDEKLRARTLKTMANHGLVRLERGPRGRAVPKVAHDRIELELPLVRSEDAA